MVLHGLGAGLADLSADILLGILDSLAFIRFGRSYFPDGSSNRSNFLFVYPGNLNDIVTFHSGGNTFR